MSKNAEKTAGFVAREAPTLQTAERPTKSFDTDPRILQQIKQVDQQRRNGINDNSLPVVNVPIPQSVTIDCPLVRPMLRQANKCEGCKYFHGVVQTAWSDDTELSWAHKYAIRCGFILERKTRQLVIE